MNDLIQHMSDDRPIAMHWQYTQMENEMLEVSYGMSHAKNLTEFKNYVSKIHAPGLNVMYGDAQDNIAWFAAAKLVQFRDSLNTKTYLDGTSGADEIIEILDFSENPQAINPSRNYVYSANHQPDSVRGKLYPGYYQPQDRSKRIVELLEAKNDFTKEDVATMIYDVKSSTVESIIKDLLAVVDESTLNTLEKTAYHALENWDGTYDKEAVGPTIYNRFLYEFMVNTYQDELGDSFALLLNSQVQDHTVPVQVQRPQSVWWDNVNTKDVVENRSEIINISLELL